jgi:hypothetical protein
MEWNATNVDSSVSCRILVPPGNGLARVEKSMGPPFQRLLIRINLDSTGHDLTSVTAALWTSLTCHVHECGYMYFWAQYFGA